MARSSFPVIFEVGRSAARADPFLALHREMNRLFDDVLRGRGAVSSSDGAAMTMPRMNVGEAGQEFRIEVELPGVSEGDVRVELAGDVLTIHGEKRVERQDMQHHIAERSFGTFARSLRLPFPADPDRVQATFHNGVLTITLPKLSPQDRVHHIPVQPVRDPAAPGVHGHAAAVAGHPTPETTREGMATNDREEGPRT
jgi:HSP20 family protein